MDDALLQNAIGCRTTPGLGTAPPAQAAGLAAVVLLFAGWALVAAFERGPWTDEFWSLWLAQPGVPLDTLLHDRWLVDFHPPLFSALHHAAMPLLGESFGAHRALNLLPLAWAIAFAAVAARRFPQAAPAILVFGAAALPLPLALPYFAELRSYFAQMSFTACLVVALFALLSAGRDFDARRDRGFAVLLGVSIFFAFNLHYLGALLAGLLVGGLAATCRLHGQREWARLLVATAIVCLLPVAGFYLAQREFLADATKHYWVTGDLIAGLVRLRDMLRQAMQANVVAAAGLFAVALATTWAAIGRLAGLAPSSWAARVPRPAPALRRAAAVLAGVLALFAAAMAALHLQQPVITGRYLLGFQVVAAGFVAALAAPAVTSRRWLAGLLLVAAAGGIVRAGLTVESSERWDATARLVVDELRACPGSPVLVAEAPRHSMIVNESEVIRYAYGVQAARFGFAVAPLVPGTRRLPAPAGDCPTLLWIEHMPASALTSPIGEVLAALGLDAGNVDLARSSSRRGETGLVLRLAVRRDLRS